MENTNRFTYRRTALASAVAVAVTAPAAQAELIDEIVVTTQKREQTLQEVPVTVSVFSGEFLTRTGATDFRDLVTLTPGVTGATEDAFIDALSFRGILTNDFGVGGDPSVAVFTDGVWQGRTGGVQMSYYDMERVEIIKGPQATLFGRNAIGGAISNTTRKPENENSGRVLVGFGEFNRMEALVTFNAALNENWSFRGNLYSFDEDGFLERRVTDSEGNPTVGTGEKFGFHDRKAIRLALRYQGEASDIVITAGQENRDGHSSVYVDGTGTSFMTPPDYFVSDLPESESKDEGEIRHVTVNADFDLSDFWSLTSITGWKQYDYEYAEDYDARAIHHNHFFLVPEVEYLSQEFRLNFDNGSNLAGFVGASVYKEDIDNYTGATSNEDDFCYAIMSTDYPGAAADPALGCADPYFQGYWYNYDAYYDWSEDPDLLAELQADAIANTVDNKPEEIFNRVENEGWAIYGDITWSATEALDLTAGVRHSSDTKQMTSAFPDSGGYLGNISNAYIAVPLDSPASDKDTWTKTTLRLAANWAVSDALSLYANYGQGYKSGGFGTYGWDAILDDDEYTALPGTRPSKFDPEESNSYELGMKSVLAGGSMQLNAGFFFYDYKDMQVIIFESGSQLVKNVGESEGKGLEVDMRWLPTDNLDISLALSFLDTEITDDSGDFCTNCLGYEVAMAPNFTGALIATYEFPIGSGNAYVSWEQIHESEKWGGFDQNPQTASKAYDVTNLQIGYDTGDTWTAVLYAENVFSEKYFERGWDLGPDFYGWVDLQTWPSRPRVVGLRFTYDF